MTEEKDTYKTLKLPSKGIFKDKGSKFLAFAFPVYTEMEIKDHLLNLRKEYFDARHHCYAYALGQNREIYRAFDDGEPSGTAGKPIYGQILSSGITNVLIIVVRYFGGTLLGTGGLITAYKNSAADAINNAEIIEKTVNKIFNIRFEYAAMNEVMKILKDDLIEQLELQFDLNCSIKISVRNAKVDSLTSLLLGIEGVRMDLLYIA
jgi:uncharacterized YigZ family protein